MCFNKNLLGQNFYKNLKQLIKLLIDEKSQELNNWDFFIKKAINAKAKAKIQTFSSCNINQHYL